MTPPAGTAADLERWVDGLVEGRRGEIVWRKTHRTVWRVRLDGRVGYAKRARGRRARDIEREAERYRQMHDAGLPAATVLAAGAHGGGEHGGAHWLVTLEAGGRPLDELLTDASRRERWALLHAVGLTARAIHDAGFSWPDMTASHLFVGPSRAGSSEGSPPVTILDVARATRLPGGHVPDAARARDLAALLFSLPYGTADRGERVRLLRTATGRRGDTLRKLALRVDAALRTLSMRTRWRHGHAGATRPVRAAVRALRGEGATTLYDDLRDAAGMTVVRALRDRENRRFTGVSGEAYFMKVYPPVRGGRSPAMAERDAIDRFQRAGVPVCRGAAYGEDVERGSFLVVEGCRGEPLDDLLRRGVTTAERRSLCRLTATMFRRMRAARLRHRDAYPCHVFAARDARRPGGFELRLIDMTRAGAAPRPQSRWFVKDAAQLWHGAPRPPVTRTDAVRWLRAYFDIPRLDRRAKRFARAVASKARRVEARQRRRRARR